jgi:hypothetical protein
LQNKTIQTFIAFFKYLSIQVNDILADLTCNAPSPCREGQKKRKTL